MYQFDNKLDEIAGHFSPASDYKEMKDLSDKELQDIYDRGRFKDYNSESEKRSRRAFNILMERKQAKELEVKKLHERKMEDDGTVRTLIANGDYTDVGYGVLVQKFFDGENAWTVKGGGYNSKAETASKNLAGGYGGAYEEAEKVAKEVITLCRRKFKKDDIILCSVNSFYSTESGIVFLEDKICTFFDERLQYIITYEEMEEIDFSKFAVSIITTDGDEVSLFCGTEDEYSKKIFNLLMDIKDSL